MLGALHVREMHSNNVATNAMLSTCQNVFGWLKETVKTGGAPNIAYA